MKKLILLISIITVISSCKERGCTDKNALNYSSLANEDDGSCRFCTEKTAILDTNVFYFTDYNSNSQYYTDQVLSIGVKEFSKKFSDTKCLSEQENEIAECPINIVFTNLTSKKEKFVFSIRIGFENQIYGYPDTVEIGAYQKVVISNLKNTDGSNSCFDLHSGFNIIINNNNYMKYE